MVLLFSFSVLLLFFGFIVQCLDQLLVEQQEGHQEKLNAGWYADGGKSLSIILCDRVSVVTSNFGSTSGKQHVWPRSPLLARFSANFSVKCAGVLNDVCCAPPQKSNNLTKHHCFTLKKYFKAPCLARHRVPEVRGSCIGGSGLAVILPLIGV